MEYKVRLLTKANVDIVEIDISLMDYPKKAERFFRAFDKQIGLIKEMPEMYPAYEELPQLRKMVLLDFLVFYSFNKDEREILIHRIRPSRMDYYRHLTEDE